MVTASKTFLAASIQHCRWLPCPSFVSSSEDGSQYEDLPVVLAGWAEDAKQHVLGVADVQLQLETTQIRDCRYKQALVQGDIITDLQVAQIGNTFLAATSSSSGSLAMLLMQLPDVAAPTTADLQFVAADVGGEGDGGFDGAGTAADRLLQRLPQVHQAPVASVAINTVKEVLLSVCGDGSISLVQQLNSPSVTQFKTATGWSGYSQGRWVDSNTFATTGVLGGLQLWDLRQGPRAVRTSQTSWGHTGCGVLDKQLGPLRQLLCLDVHPSRPDFAATGATGGTVALWDLRFHSAPLALLGAEEAAGDVCQCKFDLHGSEGSVAVPPVLYCTLDGVLCAAQDAAAAAEGAAFGGSSWPGDSSAGGLLCEVLHREQYAICSFDVEPTYGRCILAATDDEQLLLVHLDDTQQQYMQ